MRVETIARGPDGEWVTTVTDEPEPTDDWFLRVKALAESNPGEIAFGLKCNKPEHETVELLSNLQGETQ